MELNILPLQTGFPAGIAAETPGAGAGATFPLFRGVSQQHKRLVADGLLALLCSEAEAASAGGGPDEATPAADADADAEPVEAPRAAAEPVERVSTSVLPLAPPAGTV